MRRTRRRLKRRWRSFSGHDASTVDRHSIHSQSMTVMIRCPPVLFGVRGKNARTGPAGRRQVNLIGTRKREQSRKPDELYDLIEACSPGPRLEVFDRGTCPGWTTWGDEAEGYAIGGRRMGIIRVGLTWAKAAE